MRGWNRNSEPGDENGNDERQRTLQKKDAERKIQELRKEGVFIGVLVCYGDSFFLIRGKKVRLDDIRRSRTVIIGKIEPAKGLSTVDNTEKYAISNTC